MALLPAPYERLAGRRKVSFGVKFGHDGMPALSPFYPHVWTAPSWQGLSSPMQIGRCAHVFGLLRGSHDRWP